jgi:hypothetical protein
MKRIHRDVPPLIISAAVGLVLFSIGNAYSATIEPSPHKIIKTLAAQASQTTCNSTVNSLLIKHATNDVNLRNYIGAEASYLSAAQGLSLCVVQNEATQASEGNSIGMLLAFASELSMESDSAIPETYILAKYAKTLLTHISKQERFCTN